MPLSFLVEQLISSLLSVNLVLPPQHHPHQHLQISVYYQSELEIFERTDLSHSAFLLGLEVVQIYLYQVDFLLYLYLP